MNLLDWAIVLLLAWGAWDGYRRGLISKAGSLVGFLGGIWLAGAYYLPLAAFLGKSLGLERLLAALLLPLCAGASTSGALPAIPGGGSGAYPSPLWVPLLAMESGMSAYTRAHLLAGAVVKAFAFFLIMGGVAYAVGMAAALLTPIANLLFLGGLNRLAGFGLGLLERALVLVVAAGMLTPLVFSFAIGAPVPGFADSIKRAWETSLLVPYLLRGWSAAAPVLQQFFHLV
ncbi:MAG: CvpA family protein [Thermacetogeniaceae bacterium]